MKTNNKTKKQKKLKPKKGNTKTNKILSLFDKGFDVAKISLKLSAHYSFVHTVVNKYR